MLNAKSFLMGVAVVLLVLVVHRLLNPPQIIPVETVTEVIQQVPELPELPPARSQSQALNNTLTSLDQLSEAYGLTDEQKREIRRIIESAEYTP